jgi:hypothetical protein
MVTRNNNISQKQVSSYESFIYNVAESIKKYLIPNIGLQDTDAEFEKP